MPKGVDVRRAGRWKPFGTAAKKTKRVRRKELQKPPRTALIIPTIVAVAVGLATFSLLTAGALWALFGIQLQDFARDKVISRMAGKTPLDVISPTLTLIGGIGGVIALVVAFRKREQEEKTWGNRNLELEHDWFEKGFLEATKLLGSSVPVEQLAGAHSMLKLADAHPDRAQQCVDLLCSAIRLMPAAPPADEEREVLSAYAINRQTQIEVIQVCVEGVAKLRKEGSFAASDPGSTEPHTTYRKIVKFLSRKDSRPFVTMDLRGANLSRVVLPECDLSFVTLTGANLAEAVLEGSNLTKVDLRGANLSYAKLSKADFTEAKMIGANLEGATAQESTFFEANLEHTDFTNADFSDAELGKAILRDSTLDGTCIRSASLVEADLRFARLPGTFALGADFSHAVLTGVDLRGLDFGEDSYVTSFQAVVFTKAILVGANVSGLNLRGVDMQGAILEDLIAMRTDFQEATFTDSEFKNSNLRGVTLSAKFRSVAFIGCKFADAGFVGATLSDVMFLKCNLSEVVFGNPNFTDVKIIDCELPNSLRPPAKVKGLEIQEKTSGDDAPLWVSLWDAPWPGAEGNPSGDDEAAPDGKPHKE